MKTINVYAGESSMGNKVYEELPVVPIADGYFRVMASPGLVLGLAKGDEIKFNSNSGHFEVIKRGNNLCIQLYITPAMSEQINLLATEVANRFDGTMDGRSEKQVVFSVHISKGFAEIESVFNNFVDHNPGAEWYYGNVYDEEDGVTPLNWWI